MDKIDLSEVIKDWWLDKASGTTFQECIDFWYRDKDAARDLVVLSPDTVSLPYESRGLLLARLRFQFHTLTAMERGLLNAV